jgi:PAS domain S-box-containing protein
MTEPDKTREQLLAEVEELRTVLQNKFGWCKAIHDQSPIAIELYNGEGLLIEVNESCMRLFGVGDVSEIQGFSLFSDPNISEENQGRLRRGEGIRYQGSFDFEVVRARNLYRTNRNGIVWLDVLITPFGGDKMATTSGFLVQIQDITEQKKFEDELLRSEAQYRNLFDNAPVGLYRTAPDGTIFQANKAICQMLGFSGLEELTARNLEVAGFGPKTGRSEFIMQVEATGEVKNLESCWLTSNGEARIVRESAKAIRDTDGNTLYYEGSVEDITESKRVERALQETELKYERIVTNIKDAVYSVDGATGEYCYLSPAFAELTGYGEHDINEMGGRNGFLAKVLPAGKAAEHRRRFNDLQLHSAQNTYTDEIWWVCRDGTVKCLADHWTTVYKLGRLISTDGVLRDVTSAKRAEEALNEALQRAEASDRLKTAFMNNISHEVRTPLNGILGFVDMLDNEDINQEDHDLYKEILRMSADRLLSTINGYMDISLLVSGNMPLYTTDFVLAELIGDGYRRYLEPAIAKGINLSYDLAGVSDRLVVHSDPVLVRKIYDHLLENAIKFTEFGTVRIVCRKIGREVEITVEDSGIGIDPALTDKIFESFLQVDVSNTRRHEGSGLGLAIVKGLIDLLGGKIWVKSTPGYGSTFGFSLPVESFSSELPIVGEPAGRNHALTPVILIVEDDQINIFLLESMLRKTDSAYWHVTNGKLAVSFCQNHPEVSLVLMDLKMPEMDGLEATRLIKAFRPDLPIIAVTAYAMPGDRDDAINAGCDDYMSKPFTSSQLIEKLGRFITV